MERKIWERVNYERHGRYTRNWGEFYRHWRRDEGWQWPTSELFRWQHERLAKAARQHGLEPNPIAGTSPEALIKGATRKLLAVQRYTQNDIACVLPPVDELLP